MSICCTIISCSPMCFPWGFDEEDEGCTALKLILMNCITKQRSLGAARFHISMDCGVGLYAAEILQGLKEADSEIEYVGYVPFEEQATKWTPELRNRYFNALASCTEVEYVSPEKTVGCEFKAYLQAIKNADTMIIIYDPGNPQCEQEAAIVAVAEEWNKQVLAIDPKSIHLF